MLCWAALCDAYNMVAPTWRCVASQTLEGMHAKLRTRWLVGRERAALTCTHPGLLSPLSAQVTTLHRYPAARTESLEQVSRAGEMAQCPTV